MSFSPFLLLYHLSLFAVHFFSIAPFGESGNEDSDESGEQAELKQLIGLEGRFKYSQVQHYSK